jgi:hypothetical protein
MQTHGKAKSHTKTWELRRVDRVDFSESCGAVLVPGVELWVNVWCDILDGS